MRDMERLFPVHAFSFVMIHRFAEIFSAGSSPFSSPAFGFREFELFHWGFL
jgi:hypothetical protein